jgi:dihydroflavonol-4-reductase
MARLDCVTLDLDADAGWTPAMQGVDTLIHTASPFPIAQPKNPDDLIRPAVQGTLRALRAARGAGVPRVVLTSSTAAILHAGGREVKDETDWANPDAPGMTAYARSKTLAERAAWDFVRDEAKGLALTVINPGFIIGPPLDGRYGSSVGVIARILAGRDPMCPAIGFPLVDVRDVARMHLFAAEHLATAGKRYIAASGSLWMADMGRVLKAAHPDRRIPTRNAPNWLMRAMGLFDPAIRSILPALGRLEQVSNARARAEMGMAFLPPEDALRATALRLDDLRRDQARA